MLAADVKALREEVERLTRRLVEEEQEKLAVQARAAQAEATADLLRQTSKQVLGVLDKGQRIANSLLDIL